MRYTNNERHPLHVIEPFEDFKELIAQQVEKNPDGIAYRYTVKKEDRTKTFREFQNDVNALGTGLTSLGIHEKHIAMAGENCYDWIVTYLTVLGSDNVYVPVDKELPFGELMNVIDHSDAEVVFTTAHFEAKFRENAENMPRIKYFIVYGMKGPSEGRFLAAEEVMATGRKALEAGDTAYLDEKPDDMGLGVIVYTSGTTGKAKGVMLSRHNLRSCVYYGMQVSNVMPISLSVLPYNHTYESTCDILVCIHYGATVCINENLRTIADNLTKYNPYIVMLVPLFVENFYKKIWKTLEKSGKADTVRKMLKLSAGLRKVHIDLRKVMFKDLRAVFGSNIKKIVCGGAPIRSDIASFFDGIGIDLCNGYGITECSPLVSANMDNYNDYRSVGCLLPCLDVEIRDPNADGEGLICVKGDTVMMGYYKNPEETSKVLVDGWFNTGDYGKITDDKLFITGRQKNLIVLKNGKNVYPEEIESYLAVIPEISEIVVYSLRDEQGNEVALCAEIFPESAYSAGREKQEMQKFFLDKIEKINEELPIYKQVHTVRIRATEFPKTASRKIKRAGLGQQPAVKEEN